jgi:hypothetical protein
MAAITIIIGVTVTGVQELSITHGGPNGLRSLD